MWLRLFRFGLQDCHRSFRRSIGVLPCLFRPFGCRDPTFSNTVQEIKNVFQESTKCTPISKMPLTYWSWRYWSQSWFKGYQNWRHPFAEKHPIVESMVFPDPVIGIAVEPKTKTDVDRIGDGLVQIGWRRSNLPGTYRMKLWADSHHFRYGSEATWHHCRPFGNEFKVEVNQETSSREYKEAITKTTEHREVYKKQTGGRGKFKPTLSLRWALLKMINRWLEFVNEVKGNIPREFIPLCWKGIQGSHEKWSLWPVLEVDRMKVVLKRWFRSTQWTQTSFPSIGCQAGLKLLQSCQEPKS